MDDVVEHVVDVNVQCGIQSGAKLGQERGSLDRVACVGAEIIQEAVCDIPLLESIENLGPAFPALDHDEEVNIGEALDQCPVVAIAGDQDHGIDAVGIDLLACARSESHIDLRLFFIEAQDGHVLDRKIIYSLCPRLR